MLFVGVLTEALEVVGAVGRDVVERLARAFRGARDQVGGGGGGVVLFEAVAAETLGLRADHLAIITFGVSPGNIQPLLGLLKVVLQPFGFVLWADCCRLHQVHIIEGVFPSPLH